MRVPIVCVHEDAVACASAKFITVDEFYKAVERGLKEGDVKRMWTMYTEPQHHTVSSSL